MIPEPGPANDFLSAHLSAVAASYRALTGRELWGKGEGEDRNHGPTRSMRSATEMHRLARELYFAPWVLLSHDLAADPVFNYANLTAQRLFEMDWAAIVRLPSRFSAEPLSREERARLLAAVGARGFIDDYRGVRISATGRRFVIERATVWNVSDDAGRPLGQAAMFRDWTFCD